MKKLYSLFLVSIIILCLITGCSNNNATKKTNLAIGTYEFQQTTDPLNPFVSLKENNEFVFVYSSFSSYLPVGTYEINEDNLILNTSDEKYKYIFKIKNDTLVFSKEKSSSLPIGQIKDGAVFIFKE